MPSKTCMIPLLKPRIKKRSFIANSGSKHRRNALRIITDCSWGKDSDIWSKLILSRSGWLKSFLWWNHHCYLKVRKNSVEHFNELLVNCACCWVEKDDPRQIAKIETIASFSDPFHCDSHLKPCLLLRYPGHATWRKYSGVSDQHSESSCSWRKYLKKFEKWC